MNEETSVLETKDDKQKKLAKLFLRILMVIIIMLFCIKMYAIFYTNDFLFCHSYLLANILIFKINAIIIFVLMVIPLYLYLLPYFISNRLYKNGQYKKQILWGVLALIVTQVVIFVLFEIATTSYGCYSREINNRVYRSIQPCVPSIQNNIGADC